jgi:hypothetical protein
LFDPAETAIIRAQVVDVEVVELPRRAVAAELARVDVIETGPGEQLEDLVDVLCAHLLLDAIRAQSGHRPTHVEPCLV